jgi:hypothetical protein
MNTARSPSFKEALGSLCDTIGWTPIGLGEDGVDFEFHLDSGRKVKVWGIVYADTLELSVGLPVLFDSPDEIPAEFAMALLLRNAKSRAGFWCVEKIKEQFGASCMHNIEWRLLDTESFQAIITRLITEAEEVRTRYFQR